jgi:hypothetical protein
MYQTAIQAAKNPNLDLAQAVVEQVPEHTIYYGIIRNNAPWGKPLGQACRNIDRGKKAGIDLKSLTPESS